MPVYKEEHRARRPLIASCDGAVLRCARTNKVALLNLTRVEEIPPGQTKFFPLPSGPVLLANYEGKVYAVSGIFPHQRNPLECAVLWGPLIDCPWHHFQFDCRTGVIISRPMSIRRTCSICASS